MTARGVIAENCQDCNYNPIGMTLYCDWHRSTWMTNEEISAAATAMARQELYELERSHCHPDHEYMAASRGRQRAFYEAVLEQRGL